MITYLGNLLPRLEKFSVHFDDRALFLEQPWLQLGEIEERVLFVFRKTGKLLVSTNGNVESHEWEYLNNLNSILIEAEDSTTLYQQGFLDSSVMILRKDGDEDFLILINENIVDDRSVSAVMDRLQNKYLNSRRTVENEMEEKSRMKGHTFDYNGICTKCRTSLAYVRQTDYQCPK